MRGERGNVFWARAPEQRRLLLSFCEILVKKVATRAVFVGLAAVQPRIFVGFQFFAGDWKTVSAAPEHVVLVAILFPQGLKLVLRLEHEEAAWLAAKPSLGVRV